MTITKPKIKKYLEEIKLSVNKIGKITASHTKWVAQYNKTCDYKGDYDMWQYSSSESVPGIADKVDVNWCYKKF